MKTVPIDTLDEKTSQWLRAASQQEEIVVTEHGTPMVTIQPVQRKTGPHSRFSRRVLLPEYQAMVGRLSGGTDSTQIISEDRDEGGR
jgi:prevent-host-death family protein